MQNMLGMCFNWKVLLGLAVIGAAIFVIAPGWGLVALPLLILAACPLSMVVMALMMSRMGKGHAADGSSARQSPAEIRKELDQLRRNEAKLEAELQEAEAPSGVRPLSQE